MEEVEEGPSSNVSSSAVDKGGSSSYGGGDRDDTDIINSTSIGSDAYNTYLASAVARSSSELWTHYLTSELSEPLLPSACAGTGSTGTASATRSTVTDDGDGRRRKRRGRKRSGVHRDRGKDGETEEGREGGGRGGGEGGGGGGKGEREKEDGGRREGKSGSEFRHEQEGAQTNDIFASSLPGAPSQPVRVSEEEEEKLKEAAVERMGSHSGERRGGREGGKERLPCVL